MQFLKWREWVNEALSCLDKDRNVWVHLPCAGGYYDQDEQIIMIWEQIRYHYYYAMHDPSIIAQLEKKRGK